MSTTARFVPITLRRIRGRVRARDEPGLDHQGPDRPSPNMTDLSGDPGRRPRLPAAQEAGAGGALGERLRN
jgi:hypothetical protein